MTDSLESRLHGHVDVLAGDIGERHVWRPAALRAAADYIAGEWEALGLAVSRQGYEAHGIVCDNLEAVLPGSGRADQIVLAGAHYDSVQGCPGADDNGSGVAALIEIARRLSGVRLQRTVKLVAFVNEEPPFFYFGRMGSAVYARAARRRRDDIRVMLSLEMLGCYREEAGSQTYPPLIGRFYPARGDYVAFVSNLRSYRQLRQTVDAFRAASSFPCRFLASPGIVPGVSWSDHLSFWRAGYPALMVTDTAFYRYPHYHSPLDTPDCLQYESMARVVDGLAGALARLAGGAARA